MQPRGVMPPARPVFGYLLSNLTAAYPDKTGSGTERKAHAQKKNALCLCKMSAFVILCH